jgi:cytoplasmic iron level regulating protein YaaA (DUF328/UPF0246 family)
MEKQDFEINHSESPFLKEAQELVKELEKLTATDLQNLMKVSDKIASLNVERYSNWKLPFTTHNAKAALFAFKGDVYTGIEPSSLSNEELNYTQSHLSILSGLYGLLKPFDLMQAYRLEMGTKLLNKKGENLYEFWGTKIAKELNKKESKWIINLASNEYFRAVDKTILKAPTITPIFKDEKNGVFKVVSFFAKKARGMMVRYMAQNNVSDIEDIKKFNLGGYTYSEQLSKDNDWVFIR